MSSAAGGFRPWKLVRNLGIAIGSVAAIVIVMMWLMGVFKPKIGPAEMPEAGRPIGDMRLVAVERIKVPNSRNFPANL
ncbi:MAG TPA: hypothetical protein VLM89_00435 [Phycisphaerae bacterium]|nr:hypothetical protein [Phycisphaerae bacterium]